MLLRAQGADLIKSNPEGGRTHTWIFPIQMMPSELEPTAVCDPDHPWPSGQSRCWETKKRQPDWRDEW